MSMPAHMHVEASDQPWVSFLRIHPTCLLRQGPGTWAAGIAAPPSPVWGLQVHSWLFPWVLGIKTRALCLHGKCFTGWTIFPALRLYYFISVCFFVDCLRQIILQTIFFFALLSAKMSDWQTFSRAAVDFPKPHATDSLKFYRLWLLVFLYISQSRQYRNVSHLEFQPNPQLLRSSCLILGLWKLLVNSYFSLFCFILFNYNAL